MGKKQLETTFVNDKRHVLSTWYFVNGTKEIETPYVNNQFQYVNNQFHGLQIWWHNNGNIKFEVPYKKDMEHGVQITFNY